jgi:hypothetical protein
LRFAISLGILSFSLYIGDPFVGLKGIYVLGVSINRWKRRRMKRWRRGRRSKLRKK